MPVSGDRARGDGIRHAQSPRAWYSTKGALRAIERCSAIPALQPAGYSALAEAGHLATGGGALSRAAVQVPRPRMRWRSAAFRCLS